MTDAEIIKALECCKETVDDIDNESKCCSCSLIQDGWCTSTLAKNALSLINRQKAEIERLNRMYLTVCESLDKAEKQISTAKAEAIKEFAERLLGLYSTCTLADTICMDALGCDIKRLVKEMGVDGDENTTTG